MAISKSSQKKPSFQIIFQKVFISETLSLLLIAFGAGLIFLASTSFLNLDIRHPFLIKSQPELKVVNKPTKLFIPKLAKKLTISEGQVVNNRWTISQTGVSHLVDSAIPGASGNSVIYGHNLKNILGDLPNLKTGDKIYVLLKDGGFVKYQVYEQKEISPYQVEILSQTEDSRLTIFTCSGFLDTARFAVIAKQV